MTERAQDIIAFLNAAGWGQAKRHKLPQDASTRRYERLSHSGKTAIFMDAPIQTEAPPCPTAATPSERLALGWNASARLASSRIEAFVSLAAHLRQSGLSAPQILACDPESGLAIIEDFGENVLAREIEAGAAEPDLYTLAAKTIAHLHRRPVPHQVQYKNICWPILEFDRLALQVNADLFIDWAPQFFGHAPASESLRNQWHTQREALIDEILTFPNALILRDYHAENMVYLPDRDGVARIGLLDFQDAVRACGAWDMAMLLDDARRLVSPQASACAMRAYLDETGDTEADFTHKLAFIGTLNALRIVGIFARLIIRDHKPRYRQFQARQVQLLAQRLRHPSMCGIADVFRPILPGLIES